MKCAYRNCGRELVDKRSDAKFCDRNCKSCERKYNKRQKDFIERCKEEEMKNVELIKYFKNLLEK